MPWVRASLRGQKIFARADGAGALAVDNGAVEIRYKPNDGRKYKARAENLTIVDPTPLPDDTCGPAEAVVKASGGTREGGVPTQGGGGTREGGVPTQGGGGTREGGVPTQGGGGTREGGVPTQGGGGTREGGVPTDASGGTREGGVPTSAVPERAVIVYADGACSGNPGPAGLGVVIIDGAQRIERSDYLGSATNNIAELTAILRALEEVSDPERPVVIHTDSQYSIGVLQKGWKAKANTELVASLRKALAARPRARLVYVPGHAGVALNERADALAREAVRARASRRTVLGG